MNKELELYKKNINKQINKLRINIANICIKNNYDQKIKIPDNKEPLAKIFYYLELLRENLKLLDNKNKNIMKNLDNEVKERTSQLIQVEKLSALGELTAGIAHELNQPLNVIKILCQSILKDIEKNRFNKKSAREDLPEIINQVNKMAELIDHMRIFTRQVDYNSKTIIDINQIVSNSFKFYYEQLKSHNIKIITNLTPTLPEIIANSIPLEQVIINIITNARNALENINKKDKIIEINTYKEKNMVTIEIKNNGPHISDDIKKKIFHPFYTTKDPGKGTGLGLSISQKIIEEHNGKIKCTSKENEGVTFKIILPVKQKRRKQ